MPESVHRVVLDVRVDDRFGTEPARQSERIAVEIMQTLAPGPIDIVGLAIGKAWPNSQPSSGLIHGKIRRVDPETGEVIVR